MKIVHVLRAAAGGLFRHVLDLSEGQVRRGHEVGLILDGNTFTSQSRSDLARLESGLALGVSTFAMSRNRAPAMCSPSTASGHVERSAVLMAFPRWSTTDLVQRTLAVSTSSPMRLSWFFWASCAT
jgi:hypothetical protein